ncbi:MAG: hypothetical protein ACK5V5_12735 [Cyclobacteriaceae bacterium]|jgi:hypothetical protein|nr:hypothetical protein [Flammeovirgaceae bacterium]
MNKGMKTGLVLAALLMATPAFSQWKWQWGMNYVYSNPNGTMGAYIDQAHGFSFDGGMRSPDKRWLLGAEFGYSIYGGDDSRQQYQFSDDSTAEMDVQVTNAFSNLLAVARFYPRPEGVLQPYVQSKIGYSWFRTDLTIYDPNDWDNCAPVEADILKRDGTPIVSVGGGVQWDLSSVFSRLTPGRYYVDFGVNLINGGRVDFMNADGPEPIMTTGHRTDVQADFVNTQTRVVHQHHVGYLYNSLVSTMDFRLGVTFRPRS